MGFKYNTDQLQIVICRTGYQCIQRLICIPGLSGDRLRIIIITPVVEHQISLLECSRLIHQICCANRILLCLCNGLKFFVIFKQFLRDQRHIPCSCIMVLRIQSIRIFKIRIYRAKFFCTFIHLRDKSVISKSSDIFSDRIGNFICRCHQKCMERII